MMLAASVCKIDLLSLSKKQILQISNEMPWLKHWHNCM
jgi:hypothetical protein